MVAEFDTAGLNQDWMSPQEVWALARNLNGETADLSELPDSLREQDPERVSIRDAVARSDDGDLEPVPAENWPKWQIISGRFVEYSLTLQEVVARRKRSAFALKSARICESLDLSQQIILGSVSLENCRLDKKLDLGGAELSGSLTLNGSSLHEGFSGMGLLVRRGGASFAEGFVCHGKLDLLEAQIAGQLIISGCRILGNEAGVAIMAQMIKVESSVFLDEGSRFEGTVDYGNSQIGGSVYCGGASFQAPDHQASLSFFEATIAGALHLHDNGDYDGPVVLTASKIGGPVNCSGSTFRAASDKYSLSAARASIASRFTLSDGTKFTSSVDLSEAAISGNLYCLGADMVASGNVAALNCSRLRCASEFHIERSSFRGGIDLRSAQIGHSLWLSDVVGDAHEFLASLHAPNLQTGGSIHFGKNTVWKGTIDLRQSIIGGSLLFDAIKLNASVKDDYALFAPNLIVAKDVVFLAGSEISETVMLTGSEIGGRLVFAGVQILAKERLYSLAAGTLKVAGDIHLKDRAVMSGGAFFDNSEVGGSAYFTDCTFGGADAVYSFSADGMNVKRDLSFAKSKFQGEVAISYGECGGAIIFAEAECAAGQSGVALSAFGIKVRNHLFLRAGAKFGGDLNLSAAEIMGSIQLSGSEFNGEIDLTSSRVGLDMVLDDTSRTNPPRPKPIWGQSASLILKNAKLGALQGSLSAWESAGGSLIARDFDGLKFSQLSGGYGGDSLDKASIKQLRRWLRENVEHGGGGKAFKQSIFLTTAAALREAGEDGTARGVLIELEKQRTRELSFFSWFGLWKLFRLLWLGPVTGYGYAASRGAFLMVLLIIGFAAGGLCWEKGGLMTIESWTSSDWRAWLGFSFETILPIFDLDPVKDVFLEDRFGSPINEALQQKDYSSLPDGLRAFFMAERVFGIAILATLVGGLTGWAERRGGN